MAGKGMLGALLQKMGGKGSAGGKDSGTGPMDRIARMGLSERQLMLNRLWSWYRGQQYEARRIDWNGREVLEPLAAEAISSRGFIPPGFVDASGQSTPLKFRRPSSPYGLAKVIVERFTGLLFSEGQHPTVQVEGDPVTEDFVRALCEVSRMWQQMMVARTYGGGMGSVAIGFQFVDGKPMVEVHDPRWCQPQFVERSTNTLKSIEKRYQYPKEVRDPQTGRYETVWFWYRRVIDQLVDVVFEPAPVGNGQEPEWKEDVKVAHGLGFCPVVWVQNIPVQDEIDGDPDCQGTYEMMEAIDMLVAQAHRGILANCDPTLVVTSESDMGPQLQKGNGNAIQVPKGDAKYLEMTGAGSKAAMDMASQLRDMVMEVAQVVLQSPVQHNRTATEVDRNLSSMLAKADVMREQYGERAVKPLLEMMYKAAVKRAQPTPEVNAATGQNELVRETLNLPPKYAPPPAVPGMPPPAPDAPPVQTARSPGNGGTIRLKWPEYFRPSIADIAAATTAAVAAKTGGVLDQATAGRFLAKFFDVEDPEKMIAAAASEAKQAQDQMLMTSLTNPGSAFPGGPQPPPGGAPGDIPEA